MILRFIWRKKEVSSRKTKAAGSARAKDFVLAERRISSRSGSVILFCRFAISRGAVGCVGFSRAFWVIERRPRRGFLDCEISTFAGRREHRRRRSTDRRDVRRKAGVWNADLADIRAKIEKFPFVKTAAVSMVLPSGIRVNITERIPAAVVHFSPG